MPDKTPTSPHAGSPHKGLAGAGLGRRIARLPGQILVGFYVLLDSLVGPLFRPAMRLLSSLRVIRRLEAWIGGLPPYVLLVLLLVPFAVAELAKAYAVFLMGSGRFATGVGLFVGAYVVSILVCERTFSAGRAQLMTIGWFARLFTWAMAQKDRVLAWFRTTETWRWAMGVKDSARAALRRVRARMGAVFGGRPGRLFGR